MAIPVGVNELARALHEALRPVVEPAPVVMVSKRWRVRAYVEYPDLSPQERADYETQARVLLRDYVIAKR